MARNSILTTYIDALNTSLLRGDSTEHTHRPALKALVEALGNGVTATNEPKRIACGAPDFVVTQGGAPLGHIETKDVGVNLNSIEKGKGADGKQFVRFRSGLPNWILTDYVEFHWFVSGERRMTARLASAGGGRKLKITADRGEALLELLAAFFGQPSLTVRTAKDLAERLAGMTGILRGLIEGTFAVEGDDGLLHRWLSAFRRILIPDLSPTRFADMFAQTIAYGLFAARVHSHSPDMPFSRASAAFNLPRTNPFLRKLFSEIAGVDMPETIGWAVDDIVGLLSHADMASILKDFPEGGDKTDPVVHFYETFLEVYDPDLRDLRGVFYTPEPVVSYIVRSVDSLLATHFGRPSGLADNRTLILDPAVGTATFLYFVVERIKAKLVAQAGAWEGYVGSHLLSRLFGFELLMAPYAVAHLKLGMQLEQTGYHFESEQRLGIYLTNSLEEGVKRSETLFESWISNEANDAADIKRNKPILVVLGNPPYSGESANRSRDDDGNLTFIGKLIEDYKVLDGRRMKERVLKWLHDDYVKFIRFAQWRLDRTGEGIIGYITNNAYLDNPTFPGMRQALLNAFSEIWIYNLHGSTRRRERAPDGTTDQNVFDIQQGVAILIGIKSRERQGPTRVHYADVWGTREHKYDVLRDEDVHTTNWTSLTPHSPSYWFVPEEAEFGAEYDLGWPIIDIFTVHHSGIITKRDSLAIHYTAEECLHTVREFASLPPEAARERFDLPADVRDWSVKSAQDDVVQTGASPTRVIPILYRPYDVRYTYFTGKSRGFLGWPVAEITRSMLPGDNIALVTTRMTKGEEYQHVLSTQHMVEVICLSSKTSNNGFIFPLFIYPSEDDLMAAHGRQSNLNQKFVRAVAESLGMDSAEQLVPEDILAYVCAILHSPTYRERYGPQLKRNFPRVPIPTSRPLFKALASVGHKLIALQLLKSSKPNTVTFPVLGSNIVERVTFDATRERLSINATQYFGHVLTSAWGCFVGGYRVAEKWLTDRKGRKLTYDDIQRYQQIVGALEETPVLMSEVDAEVTRYGGWPITSAR